MNLEKLCCLDKHQKGLSNFLALDNTTVPEEHQGLFFSPIISQLGF